MAKAKKKTSAKKRASSRGSLKRKKAQRKSTAKKAAKKKSTKRTTSAKRKSVNRATKKKSTKKKTTTRKAVSKKKSAKKKPTKKKPTKKKAVKKKKATKKKPVKKATAKKKSAQKENPPVRAKKTRAKEKSVPAKKPARRRAKNTAIAKTAIAKPAAPIVRKRLVNLEDVKLPQGYNLTAKQKYMNPQHLLYFRNKLQEWRDELIVESQETLEHLRSEIRDVGDEAERASRESDNILELRTRDRYRKLLKKIDDAMKRIEDGSYGYCEETGEEIGLERLAARPIATLTVDAQERRELFQRQFRDDR